MLVGEGCLYLKGMHLTTIYLVTAVNVYYGYKEEPEAHFVATLEALIPAAR